MWVLVHSPLLSPVFWEPVAEVLRAGGQSVLIADLSDALAAGGDYTHAQADLVADAVDAERIRLVAHSGAGPVLPAIAERLAAGGVTVSDSVFVDAGLPHPGRSRLAVLPEPAAAQLRELTTDGWLPAWPSWWSPDQLEAMVPDSALRRELVAHCPRLPAGLFSQAMPEADERGLGRRRFCRLSAGYDAAADQAQRAGWRVSRLIGHHLSAMSEPVLLADAIEDIVVR